MFPDLPANLAALGFGYLLGSIPFGLVLTKLFGEVDPRTIGSQNIGATNVLRTGNKKLAAATLLLDALKGTLAVIVAAQFGPYYAILAGLGAFLGHLYPVWLRFKGGKGVATFLGVALGLAWPRRSSLQLSGWAWLTSRAIRQPRPSPPASLRPPRFSRWETATRANCSSRSP